MPFMQCRLQQRIWDVPVPLRQVEVRFQFPQYTFIPPKYILACIPSCGWVDEHDQRRINVASGREEREPISDKGPGCILVYVRILLVSPVTLTGQSSTIHMSRLEVGSC